MTLEEPAVLKAKNRKRLSGVTNAFLVMGVDLTSPFRLWDPLRTITLTLIAICLFDMYGHAAYIRRHSDSLAKVLESLCPCFHIAISLIKLIYIMFTQRRFYDILKTVRTHELIDKIPFLTDETPMNKELRKDVTKILDQCWRVATNQFKLFVYICIIAINFYFSGAIAINTYNSIIGNTNHTNILAFPSLFPFWEDKMNKYPYYPILTLAMGLGAFMAGACSLGFDGIFIIMAMHCVALFRTLRKTIAFTTSPIVPKGLRLEYLRRCMDHSERTYQFCEEFNNLYLHLSLIQFLVSVVVLGAIMFQIALGVEKDFMVFFQMVMHLSAAINEVLIYCLNGQFVTSESEMVAFAWYDCEWYNEPREFRRLIGMMIMRTNRIVQMRASWFTTMSLSTFMEIIRTSASYFLLLRNVGT